MNLNQITVGSTNIGRSIEFYQRLGLKLIVHSGPHYARFVAPEGSTTFSVHLVDAVPKSATWIYFEIDELDEKVESLQDSGLSFDELPSDKSWLWREARLSDPDGNIIILYHAGENRLNPPWRINPV